MIRYRYTELDGAFGCEYTFESAQEFIKEHKHSEELRHSSRCLKGKALIEIHPSGTGEPQWLVLDENSEASEPDFDSRLLHRITALEAGTMLFNRMYVRPNDAEEIMKCPIGTME